MQSDITPEEVIGLVERATPKTIQMMVTALLEGHEPEIQHITLRRYNGDVEIIEHRTCGYCDTDWPCPTVEKIYETLVATERRD